MDGLVLKEAPLKLVRPRALNFPHLRSFKGIFLVYVIQVLPVTPASVE